ncbi:MAG: tetraacyldisaccharide 4'-kinase [Henriciella sp.]
MRPPYFWSGAVDPRSREGAPLTRILLTPLACIYAGMTARRLQRTTPLRLGARVLCVGNLTVGGTGKSPVVDALRRRITAKTGLRTASLSRGYKGRLKGPCQVEPSQHGAGDVGDEPLMLAQSGESWIGADRAKAGTAMEDAGVDVIIMDDGHQNPGLFKDLTIIVIDAQVGFGNGHVIPKGPLRESPVAGLQRADLVLKLGEGPLPDAVRQSGCPVMEARIVPTHQPEPGPYVGFAGIGRPEKFFETLRSLGLDLCDAIPFPDHHTYRPADLAYLHQLAEDHNARLITTEKDLIRLPEEDRAGLEALGITIQFDDEEGLDSFLQPIFTQGASHG